MSNPIADLLKFDPTDASRYGRTLTIDGFKFEYFPKTEGTFEALYRLDAAWGVSNPAFSLAYVRPADQAMMLGQYLGKTRRGGMKRQEAECRVISAIVHIA